MDERRIEISRFHIKHLLQHDAMKIIAIRPDSDCSTHLISLFVSLIAGGERKEAGAGKYIGGQTQTIHTFLCVANTSPVVCFVFPVNLSLVHVKNDSLS